MVNDELIDTLQAYGPILEKTCVKACKQMLDNGDWSEFELQEGYQEIWRLSQGRDLAYDRPSIGVHYALWYHLQRTHYLIRALTPLLRDRQAPIAIYDAGCGTGAAAWAAATVAAGLSDAGHQVPPVSVFGKDTSPFMLQAAESLWTRLAKNMPADVRVNHSLGSWTNPPISLQRHEDILVVCAFLLNSSDKRYLNELSKHLSQVYDKIGARRLLMVSPSSKHHLATALYPGAQWETIPLKPLNNLWNGKISKLGALRNELLASIDQNSRWLPSWSVTTKPNFLLLERRLETLTDSAILPTASTRRSSAEPSTSSGHDTSVNILDKKQDKAAEPADQLTYVVGAAGSGKSLVLCERVVRLMERARAGEPVNALITTFNKALVNQLFDWIEERILCSSDGLTITDSQRGHDQGDQYLTVSNAFQVTSSIRLLNRDRLPTRIWQEPAESVAVLRSAPKLDSATTLVGHNSDTFEVEEDFLARELELIVLGMERLDEVDYVDPQKTPRRGRKTPLTRVQRIALWPQLASKMSATTGPYPFLRRRLAALRHYQPALTTRMALELREGVGPFTHVFVDEAQDMTRADLRLLVRTARRPQGFFAAGDTTQALHTAGLSPRPEIEGTNWRIHELSGSYRLPALVCEALQPLANEILREQSEAVGAIPEVRRSAVPGPRPVVVNAKRIDQMAAALRTMSRFISQSKSMPPVWSVICEPPGKTHPLMTTLKQCGVEARCESMLRIKGLELPLVIFPTDAAPPFDDATAEWAYTALTRSTCVVVIAVSPETSPEVAGALRHIDPSREQLMYWDESARSAWDEMT